MPIPIEKIQVVEDEIERQHDDERDHHHHHHHHFHRPQLHSEDENDYRHGQAMTPPEQDFSYLKRSTQGKRSVHYDIEPMNQDEQRPLRIPREPESPLENVLRRRYIAHWGLPGLFE